MGFWDRNGFPNFYTGSVGNGVAPLNSYESNAGIQGMWATRAGYYGRPANMPGHVDDYWANFDDPWTFESTDADPYAVAGRLEHEPDCIGDFIGLSQGKWPDLNGECSGNINGYAFNFWDAQGGRLLNFQPDQGIRDIQSGLRAWAKSRGYEADVASQLVDTNPTVPGGKGFTFADLKAEIDAGFPVLLILQHPNELSRSLEGNSRANPSVHAMVAHWYLSTDAGIQAVRYRTSWASGDTSFAAWGPGSWEANLPLRGVITFRPKPKIVSIKRADGQLEISWHGPSATIHDQTTGEDRKAHWYVVERAHDVVGLAFAPAAPPTSDLNLKVIEESSGAAFYRVRLMTAEEAPRQ